MTLPTSIRMPKQNTNRQLRLVQNLLDVTKLSAGHIQLNNSSIDIVLVTKAIADTVQIYAKQKNIKVNFISEFDKKEIYIDEEKIERILLNLLSNALKFTPSGKTITVTLFEKTLKRKKMICISVKDEGIGIPKNKHKHVFNKFGQANSSISRFAEGVGLGLYLVELLVSAMEGKIILESEEWKGCTFTVFLPDIQSKESEKMEMATPENLLFFDRDPRIIQAATIEFSDIYFEPIPHLIDTANMEYNKK